MSTFTHESDTTVCISVLFVLLSPLLIHSGSNMLLELLLLLKQASAGHVLMQRLGLMW